MASAVIPAPEAVSDFQIEHCRLGGTSPDIFSASFRSFASAKTAKDAKGYPPCCCGSRGS
jgi:hypothetical protein